MPRSDEHAYDDLVREAERVLRTVESPAAAEAAAVPEPSFAAQELASLEAEGAESEDGYVEVRIPQDRMSARAAFFPAVGGGKQIEFSEVRDLLIARGLRFGIDWEAVKSAILACNTSLRPQHDVEVARGRPPRDEVPASVAVEESLLKKAAPEIPDTAAVDFKEISPFVFVKKGDVLARITPRIEGVSGIDVTGAAVSYGTSAVSTVKPGRNTVVEGETVRAACDGRFVSRADSFWVSEVLEIPGDVDLSTGHIDFAGDVIVRGQIKQGFKVKAGGSLFCARLVDALEISCGGDLQTGQGILGRMRGTVKVGGSVRAKFIENCYLEAGGDVVVTTGCLNSVVCTLGAVTTGPRGVIIGGKITARRGVSALHIGSAAGARTEIVCGVDYRVRQELTRIRDQNIALALKLKQVETALAGPRRGDAKLMDLQGKLKAAIRRLNDAARARVPAMHEDESAAVTVRGDIHHGVSIEICNVPLVISRSMSRTRFRLDKTFGIISPDRLA